MATWRNWLRTLLLGAKETQAVAAPAPVSLPHQGKEDPAAAPPPIAPQPTLDLTQLPDRFPLQPLKTWISQNVSFYAWDRIVLRSLPLLRQDHIKLAEAMNPTPLTQASRDTLKALLQSLQDLYQIAPPATLLQQGESRNNS